jgi:hypothetical protein
MATSIFFLFRLAAVGDPPPPPRGLALAESPVALEPATVRIAWSKSLAHETFRPPRRPPVRASTAHAAPSPPSR